MQNDHKKHGLVKFGMNLLLLDRRAKIQCARTVIVRFFVLASITVTPMETPESFANLLAKVSFQSEILAIPADNTLLVLSPKVH
ncbi:MAG: hypothetical protein AAF090_16615 [Bacteroidota bacterium]